MDEPGDLRRLPLQQRSARRLDLILDTAAALIDEAGSVQLTPTLIARSAGMSHAAIYRYFADTPAILRALAARNLERYLAVVREIIADPDILWQDAMRQIVDAYAEKLRSEPGFRWVRLGDGIDSHLFSSTATNKHLLAIESLGYFRPRFDVWDRPELYEHVEVMLEIADALVSRAFLTDPQGDPFFIAEARRLTVGYLEEFLLTVPGREPDPIDGAGLDTPPAATRPAGSAAD